MTWLWKGSIELRWLVAVAIFPGTGLFTCLEVHPNTLEATHFVPKIFSRHSSPPMPSTRHLHPIHLPLIEVKSTFPRDNTHPVKSQHSGPPSAGYWTESLSRPHSAFIVTPGPAILKPMWTSFWYPMRMFHILFKLLWFSFPLPSLLTQQCYHFECSLTHKQFCYMITISLLHTNAWEIYGELLKCLVVKMLDWNSGDLHSILATESLCNLGQAS